jgi:ADP-ribosylglycohydrolase
MIGALCGDVLGAPYEINTVTFKDFILLADNGRYTDDTVCSLAIADSVLSGRFDFGPSLKRWGKQFGVSYGNLFEAWINSSIEVNDSAGNGSVSRVSSLAWLASDLDQAMEWAAASAMTSHRHPHSVDAACAVTAATWLALDGWSKDDMARVIEAAIGYDLSTPLDTIRPGYGFRFLAAETAPVALRAVIEGMDFEDVMRLSISMGGDADTIAAAAGGVAEVYHPIPEDMHEHVMLRLPPEALEILAAFDTRRRVAFDPHIPSAEEIRLAVETISAVTGRYRALITAGPPLSAWKRSVRDMRRALARLSNGIVRMSMG